jgi:hypothetical protein
VSNSDWHNRSNSAVSMASYKPAKSGAFQNITEVCKAAEQKQNKSNKAFVKGLNKLSKEGKMSGLFNLLHKPPPQQAKNDPEMEQQMQKDKSGDEFDEDEDQEVDGLFFGELSPNDHSGRVSNVSGLGMANMNKELEDSPDAMAQMENIGLDAQNFQTLINNPALTQHLITVLTTNLQKQEQQK